MKDNIGRAGFPALLVERGLIAASGLEAAQSRAARDRMELADAVVALGVKEHDSYAALAAAAGAELIALGDVRSSDLAVRLVPERLARRHLIVPLEVDNRVLTYATCRPFNVEGENDLQFAAGRRTAFKVATRTAILGALDACYRSTQPSDTFTTGRRRPEPASPLRAVPAQGAADATAVIEMCHQIIARALAAKAEDVQLETAAHGSTIRYRIGGTFESMPDIPVESLNRVMDRFKILARVATAVRNRPQNGAFLLTVNERPADVRLSTRPTPNGEMIALRIIDPTAVKAAAPTQPKRRGRIRVLVTDDEPISRMVVKVLLEHDNYDVIEAVDGQQAIEMAVRERPNLVLIDLNMPVMDGYEAITALRREFTLRELPIIVLTSEEGDSVERRVLELGADDYLVKPFEPAVLMARVNAVFHRLNLLAS